MAPVSHQGAQTLLGLMTLPAPGDGAAAPSLLRLQAPGPAWLSLLHLSSGGRRGREGDSF